MIPVSSEEYVKVPDPDDAGVSIHLRYLLDKNQVEFFKLFRQFQNTIGINVSAGVDPEIREAEIKIRLVDKLEEALPVIDGLINLFVCGWSGKRADNKPLIPFKGNPSSRLTIPVKMQLIAFIFDNLDELISMKTEEMGK